ncbi:hypothetical protein QQ045_014173 [Rhodiola kirilowii]
MKISDVLLISLFAVFASLEMALSLEADGLCTVAAIMNNDHESECSVVDCQQSCEEIGPLTGRCNRVSDDKSKCHCYASCFALAADTDFYAPLSSVADAPAPSADSSSDAPLPSSFNNEEYYADAPSPDEAPLPSFNEEYNAEAPSPDSDIEAPLPSFNEEYNAEAPLADDSEAPSANYYHRKSVQEGSLDRISPGGPNPEHHTSPLSSFEEYNAEAATLSDDSEAPSADTNIDPPLPGFEEYNAEAPLADIEWDGAPAPSIWI